MGETANMHEQLCSESLSKEINDLEQGLKRAELELVEQLQQDRFVSNNREHDADAGAVTDAVGGLKQHIRSLRRSKIWAENKLLVAKAEELVTMALVPQDVRNRPECSCAASLALEEALQHGVLLQSHLREMALKLAFATKESEQVSSNINAAKEQLRAIKSVMTKGDLPGAVKRVKAHRKVYAVFDRLYADAKRRDHAVDARPGPARAAHGGNATDLLPTYTESQASKPSEQSTDAPSRISFPLQPSLVSIRSLPNKHSEQ